MTRRIPLSAEYRWYGSFMLAITLLVVPLTNGVLATSIPPSMRGTRVPLLVAACLLPGLLGLLITRSVIWPVKYRQIASAEPVDQLPSTKDYTLPRLLLMLALLVVLLLVVADIATALRVSGGMLAALMIASASSASNFTLARRLGQLEREQHVIYYGVPLSPSVNSMRRVVVLCA